MSLDTRRGERMAAGVGERVAASVRHEPRAHEVPQRRHEAEDVGAASSAGTST